VELIGGTLTLRGMIIGERIQREKAKWLTKAEEKFNGTAAQKSNGGAIMNP